MTGHKDSLQVQRLEVVNTVRRRRWSVDEKLRIVAESFQGHRQVSATARRHDISPALLFSWRKAFQGSVSPTHGDQDGSAYNGHFGGTCYHPLFLFNQFGDLERCALRPERWRQHYHTIRPHSSLGYQPPAPETILLDPANPTYAMLRPAQQGPNQRPILS